MVGLRMAWMKGVGKSWVMVTLEKEQACVKGGKSVNKRWILSPLHFSNRPATNPLALTHPLPAEEGHQKIIKWVTQMSSFIYNLATQVDDLRQVVFH